MRAGFQTLLGAVLIAGATVAVDQSVSAMPVAGVAAAAKTGADVAVPAYYRCGYYGCHRRYRSYYYPRYRYYGGYYRPYAPHLGIGLGGFGLGLY